MEIPVLQSVLQDIRYTLRGMRGSPGFTAVAVTTLAVAIGINAGVFTIARTVLFGGYPGIDPENRIVYIPVGSISNADFASWKAQVKSFSGIAGVADGGLRLVLQDGGGNSETCDVTQLSTNAFQVLRRRPILGRDFAPSDGAPGSSSVALLNYGFWERRFHKDPAVIGKPFRLDDKPVTVIGVMPPGFTFPTSRVDLWTQVVADSKRPTFYWFAFGRLAPGATRQSAQAEMNLIGRRLESSYLLANQGLRLQLRSFGEQFLGPNAIAFYGATWWAVGFVLVIGCVNLANLLLGRAIGPYREISLRIVLGAGRWRIIRQLLIESLMLSAIAALLGWFLALASVRIYERIESPPGFYNQYRYAVDSGVLLYLVAISMAAGLLFGLAAALRLSRLGVHSALNDGGRGATGGIRGKRLSALLIAAEIAVTCVLLAGAGLLARSFLKMYAEEVGVDTPNILVASVQLPARRYPDDPSRMAFFDKLITNLRSIPGLNSVALADGLPGVSASRLPYQLAESPAVEEQRRPMAITIAITPDYFRTVGAAVIAGRDFNQFDRASTPAVAMVSERFARAHWPGVSPLGKRFRLFDGRDADAWRTVVGVASNIIQRDWAGNESDQAVYIPYQQRPPVFTNILAFTRVPSGTLAALVRREIRTIDPELDIGAGAGAGANEGPVPLSESFLTARYWSRAVNAGLLLTFAVIALLLAMTGLYAVVAHSVARRTQEIGVRVAIGASARDVRRLVLRQGMLPVVIGLVTGLVASVGFNRLLRSQLFSVSSSDPATYAVASVVLFVVALLACLIPARRAMRVDPAVALRHE